jgi:hypothetical protein
VRPTSLRLQPTYDASRLAEDLRSLAHLERARPGPFATEGWDGIALVQAEGRADDTRSPMPSRSGPLPTPALATCPALAALLEGLPAPILAARLLYLQPGGSAGLHRDPVAFPLGVVRLHVPIITHPDVELWIGGERMQWGVGELWYGDFTFPHRLANPSPITRVHLVLDICVTDALLALFPSDALPSLLADGVHRFVPARRLDDAALGRFARHLTLPHAAIAGVNVASELDGVVEDGAIAMRAANGDLAFVLDPIDEASLVIRGYYPGVTFEYPRDGTIELVHRGRVVLPEGMSDDDERAPWNLVTTRWPVNGPIPT